MRTRRILLSAALCAQVMWAVAQPATPAAIDLRRVVEPGAMLDASGSRSAACQPKRGDAVAVLRKMQQPGAMHASAEVRVLSGRCKGAVGWIGTHRLAAGND